MSYAFCTAGSRSSFKRYSAASGDGRETAPRRTFAEATSATRGLLLCPRRAEAATRTTGWTGMTARSRRAPRGHATGFWRRGGNPAIPCTPADAHTTRNPLLSFWLSGSLLLRFAPRRLSASLLNEPPRNTRDGCASHPWSHCSTDAGVWKHERTAPSAVQRAKVIPVLPLTPTPPETRS